MVVVKKVRTYACLLFKYPQGTAQAETKGGKYGGAMLRKSWSRQRKFLGHMLVYFDKIHRGIEGMVMIMQYKEGESSDYHLSS